MKRKFSPPPLVADHRKRKKRTAGAGDIDELPFPFTEKPVPHLLVTKVLYTPLSHNHNPSNNKFPCAFNRRGSIVSVPLDGSIGKARPTSAAIHRRGRLADLYRRCVPFIGATSRGHLAFAASNHVFLLNPVTDALHCIDTFGYCNKAVLANGGHGCNVFVSLGALLSQPALWRLDEDGERWSKYPVANTGDQTGDIMSAVNCNGCFYLLHEDGCVSKIDSPRRGTHGRVPR